MVSVQEQRTIRSAGSIPDITPVASDHKHVMHWSNNSSFRTIYPTPGATRNNVRDADETLAHKLESEDESHLPIPVHGQDLTSAPPKSITERLGNTRLRSTMRQVAHEEADFILTSRVVEEMSRSAEEILSETLHICFESANDGLMMAFFHSARQI